MLFFFFFCFRKRNFGRAFNYLLFDDQIRKCHKTTLKEASSPQSHNVQKPGQVISQAFAQKQPLLVLQSTKSSGQPLSCAKNQKKKRNLSLANVSVHKAIIKGTLINNCVQFSSPKEQNCCLCTVPAVLFACVQKGRRFQDRRR